MSQSYFQLFEKQICTKHTRFYTFSSFRNSNESTIHFFLHCANYTFQRKALPLLKCSYLENRILKTHLTKKLLTLPLDSYYQQSALTVLYFQADLSHSIALQYLFSLFYLFLLCLLSYSVFIITSYSKSILAWIQLVFESCTLIFF